MGDMSIMTGVTYSKLQHLKQRLSEFRKYQQLEPKTTWQLLQQLQRIRRSPQDKNTLEHPADLSISNGTITASTPTIFAEHSAANQRKGQLDPFSEEIKNSKHNLLAGNIIQNVVHAISCHLASQPS